MATFVKRKLSGSTDGKMIKISATSTPGTTVHTATSGTSAADDYDEVYLWLVNSDSATRKVTVEFGGTTSPDDLVELYMPPETGPVLVIPGWPLQNAAVVKVFAASANVIMAAGYVNRIAP